MTGRRVLLSVLVYSPLKQWFRLLLAAQQLERGGMLVCGACMDAVFVPSFMISGSKPRAALRNATTPFPNYNDTRNTSARLFKFPT